MQVGLKFIQCIGSNVMIACWAVAEAPSLWILAMMGWLFGKDGATFEVLLL